MLVTFLLKQTQQNLISITVMKGWATFVADVDTGMNFFKPGLTNKVPLVIVNTLLQIANVSTLMPVSES